MKPVIFNTTNDLDTRDATRNTMTQIWQAVNDFKSIEHIKQLVEFTEL